MPTTDADMPTGLRKYIPDTQSFLAIAIVGIVVTVVVLLLTKEDLNLNDKLYGALMTLLGVVAACFKDTFSFYFGSSKGSEKKDDAMLANMTPPNPPNPPTAPLPVAPVPAPAAEPVPEPAKP